MSGSKKINIQEDQYGLTIDFKWWSPVAIFLGVFALVWNGFLITWYSMLDPSTPFIFFLFPLLHVAAGIWVAHSALTLFFNKTYINVEEGWLNIYHTPIPVRNNAIKIQTKDIYQIYIKEKIHPSESNTSRRLHLHAKLKDGRDKELISVMGLDYNELLEIEDKLEEHLGIQNQYVAGEYAAKKNSARYSKARRKRRYASDLPIDFFHLSIRDQFLLDEINHEVRFKSQSDWTNGNTDVFVQLLDELDEEKLIYVRSDRGLEYMYLEKKLSLAESRSIVFLKENPPDTINIKGQTFDLEAVMQGEQFTDNLSDSSTIKQWIYQSIDKQLRIEFDGHEKSFYLGSAIEENRLDDKIDRLDLEDFKKQREIRPNYDEEDLV